MRSLGGRCVQRTHALHTRKNTGMGKRNLLSDTLFQSKELQNYDILLHLGA